MAYKKTLGRGLESLIPSNDSDSQKNKTDIETIKPADVVTKLDIDKIVARDNQPRKIFAEESLMDLANSIKEYGLLNPIVVTKVGDKYEILAGERRYRATKLIGERQIDVIIREYDQKDIEILSLVENVQREDLSSLEEANAYKNLSDNYDMTQEEIAKLMGKSRSYIANTMRLIRLSDMEKKALEENKITRSQARTLLSIEEDGQRVKSLDDFIHNRVNIRSVEEINKKTKKELENKDLIKEDKKSNIGKNSSDVSKENSAPDIDEILVEDFEERFMDELGSKVSINKIGKMYKVVIDCFTIEDIESLFGRLSDETD